MREQRNRSRIAERIPEENLPLLGSDDDRSVGQESGVRCLPRVKVLAEEFPILARVPDDQFAITPRFDPVFGQPSKAIGFISRALVVPKQFAARFDDADGIEEHLVDDLIPFSPNQERSVAAL